jgi:two-component system response regulator MtrA
VLVGNAARDHERIEALLAANVIVILLSSLETMSSLLTPEPESSRFQSTSRVGGTFGELCVDVSQHRVLLGQRELPVTERELAILATLCNEPGRAHSFAELAQPGGRSWPGDTDGVHSAVRRLRRKLAEAGVEATIESIRGYGFRIADRSPPAIGSGPIPLSDEATATQG